MIVAGQRSQVTFVLRPRIMTIHFPKCVTGICSPDKRFEVDEAYVARDYLNSHGLPTQVIKLVLDAAVLHATPGSKDLRNRKWLY